jgi:Zn-finger nucleic acid-binding protein
VDAFALHCPNCGSAVDAGAARCPYCQGQLATISCPQCFALIFDGAVFCPRCGTRRTRVESDGAVSGCPGCGGTLHQVAVGVAALLECARCDGVWLDAAQFERICADHEAQAAVLHRQRRDPSVTPAGPVRYRPCLRCRKMMNRVNFGRLSGTVVDVCRGHGTFLDAGELHAIVTFIQSGGLERMREREIEELRDEHRRLRQAQDEAHRSDGRHAGTSWTGADLQDLLDALKIR